MPDKKPVNDVKVVEAVDNATGEQVQVPVSVPEDAPTSAMTGSSSKPGASTAKQYKPPIAGATEPMEQALRNLFTPPVPAEPTFSPPAIEPEPHEAEHWADGAPPKEWEPMRDEAQQVAREAANAAYARGVSEQDAITEGVIQAQNWAKAHSVNIRK